MDGVRMLTDVVNNENTDKLEIMNFVFQMRCTPLENILYGTPYFHYCIT
jgi:hypothetical protein